VPTDIYFAGDGRRVTVDEDPSAVAEALGAAKGLPLRLTVRGGGELYINPGMVAFWSTAERCQSAPVEEPEQTPISRETVTDIWGQPVRRKPRR
jgi:hypothetical protein